MKQRFRLFRRSSRVYYLEDTVTQQQESLRTKDKVVAQKLHHAKNNAHEQPALNRQLARTYLAAGDPEVVERTWQDVMGTMAKTKSGSTLERWQRAIKDHAFDNLRSLKILETRSEHLLDALERGTVATNVFLRRIYNFALDMNWLPWPLIPKKQWPAVKFKTKRAITFAEHADIVEREGNPERKAFYELCWHLGGSQSDIAYLSAEDIRWADNTISYRRQKTRSTAVLHFGEQVAVVLRNLPSSGPLFPYLRSVRATDRGTEFKQRCRGLGIEGVTLHSYRYAWAQRAMESGYPERYAMQALGHNSPAVHRAYARKAEVRLPSLEDYEKKARKRRHKKRVITPFPPRQVA